MAFAMRSCAARLTTAGASEPCAIDAVTTNYFSLLATMGQGEAQIAAEIAELWREAGLEP